MRTICVVSRTSRRSSPKTLKASGSRPLSHESHTSSGTNGQSGSEDEAAELPDQAPLRAPRRIFHNKVIRPSKRVKTDVAESSCQRSSPDDSDLRYSDNSPQVNKDPCARVTAELVQKPYTSLAEAPPLSNTDRDTPLRSGKRPTAAGYFTCASSPEPEGILPTQDSFTIEDIERLIEEEKLVARLTKWRRLESEFGKALRLSRRLA